MCGRSGGGATIETVEYRVPLLLMMISVLSKYTWLVPLKSKMGRPWLKGLPLHLQADACKEFCNATFQRFLEREGIRHFITWIPKPWWWRNLIIRWRNAGTWGTVISWRTTRGLAWTCCHPCWMGILGANIVVLAWLLESSCLTAKERVWHTRSILTKSNDLKIWSFNPKNSTVA